MRSQLDSKIVGKVMRRVVAGKRIPAFEIALYGDTNKPTIILEDDTVILGYTHVNMMM